MTLALLWTILYYAWVVSEVLIAVITRTKKDSGGVHDRGSMLLLWIVIFSSMTACEFIKAMTAPDMFGGAEWLSTVGLLVLVTGLAIRWGAVLSLGKAFSANVAIRESQTLNTSGLYRFVRHPSYLGLLLVFVSVGVHSRHWLSLACASVPTMAALLYRIYIEEAALRAAFGGEYVAYSKSTKRLIPGVI